MSAYSTKSDKDFGRIFMLVIAIIISCFVGYNFQPEISENKDAVNTIVTIFSILAGFLIAIITLISEPILKQAKNWEELQAMKPTIRKKLFRQNALFILYLITLGLALIMFLVPAQLIEIQKYLQMCFLGLATFVFLVSFTLPGSLTKIQMDRYDVALEDGKPKIIKSAQKILNDKK